MCFLTFMEGGVQNIAFGDAEGGVTMYEAGTLANQARRFLSMKKVASGAHGHVAHYVKPRKVLQKVHRSWITDMVYIEVISGLF